MTERDGPTGGRPVAVALARAAYVVCFALTAVGLVLWWANRDLPAPMAFGSRDATALWGVAYLAFPLFGALIARRRPDSSLWWVFSLVGVLTSVWLVADGYAVRATAPGGPGGLPAGPQVAWLADVVWIPAWLLVGRLFLYFPDGALPSRRWRHAVWLLVGVGALLTGGLAFAPGALRNYPWVANPLGLEGPGTLFAGARDAGLAGLGGLGALCVAGLLTRLRRAEGVQRQQLKWLAAASVLVVGVLVVGTSLQPFFGFDSDWAESLAQLSALAVPVAAGVAILRYRLYDIDVIIRRTVAHGLLSALLAAVFVAVYLPAVALVSVVSAALLPFSSNVAVAVAVLAVYRLFQPARTRIQRQVDRRFHRERYDAVTVVRGLDDRLRSTTDLDGVCDDVLAAVRASMRPASVSLWLRPSASAAAASTPDTPAAQATSATMHPRPPHAGKSRAGGRA